MTNPLFRRSDQAIFAPVGDDIVALHISEGKCYGMENVTAAVWNLLAEPATLEQLIDTLMERYAVEPAQCRSEVVRLLDQMVDEGLVEALPPAGKS